MQGQVCRAQRRCDWRPVASLHSERVARKKMPREGKRAGEGMFGVSCVGGVGRSQTREGKGVSGRGGSVVLAGTAVVGGRFGEL